MSGSYPGNLRVWEAWDFLEAPGRVAPVGGRVGGTSPSAEGLAERLGARETLRPAGRAEEVPEPYTLQWFLHLESKRHGRYARWIPRLLEFTKHAGETLLGLGNGLGTDLVQYASHGAAVVVCGPEGDELALARRNFELRGLTARFVSARLPALPLESASIDVACVGPLLEWAEPAALADELHRVLKPGGKVLALVPARLDMDWWVRYFFPWQRLLSRPAFPGPPGAGRFTGRELRRLFGRFTEHRIHKRHLRRAEVPHVWRWLPLPMLERWFGHFLILKAFKPLSAAIALPAAA